MGALGLPLLALLFGARAGAPTLCEGKEAGHLKVPYAAIGTRQRL